METTATTLGYRIDSDGIMIITLDDPSRPMNVVSPELITDLIAAIEKVATDPAIKGAVITSGKPAFMAGADLKYILQMQERGVTAREVVEFAHKPSFLMHRRMETCGKPFVAAINGLALGGGYELALACHYRVIADDPKALVGLPEVTVGLIPGSGGTQRLPRMIGVQASLPILLEGKTVTPAEALKLGMVDAVVPPAQLLEAARQWILKSPDPVRAWDRKGYRGNLGLLDPAIAALMMTQPALLAAKTQRNYPAPIAILTVLFDGMLMPFDKALQLEAKYFARLLSDPISRNIIRTTFVSKGEAGKLVRRPAGVPASKVRKVGVLGAGMMGSGIAYVSAAAGIQVVLLDSRIELAEKGRQYSVKLLDKAVERGKQTRPQADAILSRITAGVSYPDLSDCDLIVEAVFEDLDIKADVTARAEAVIPPTAIFASNTSTLPITQLARGSKRPAQFIGLHFFSPVDRMPMVEVILGAQTSPEALARSLDFVQQLRMTPIVVKDSRGFYTSRVFQTFIHEGMKMLEDGVAPALIENAARAAGFPVGPLAVTDEVSIELPWKIVKQAEAASGSGFVRPCAYNVMRRMLEELHRPGKRDGKGFYEYGQAADDRTAAPGQAGGAASGQPKGGGVAPVHTKGPGSGKFLWPGLAQAFPAAADQPPVDEVKTRLLYIQALESARCFEEGVLTHAADADVGSVLAWGYPSWTGGTLSLIDTVGIGKFVAECERMAKAYGPRFAPSDWLKQRADRNDTFYTAATSATA